MGIILVVERVRKVAILMSVITTLKQQGECCTDSV